MSEGMSWPAISAIAAAIGLFINGLSAMRAANTQRLANLNSVRGRIQDLQLRLGEIKAITPPASPEQIQALDMKQVLWDEVFFNELEWLSALYLRGEVPEDLMLNHLGPALVRYYDQIYLRTPRLHSSAADPELYRCFKTVVGLFRGKIPAARSYPASNSTSDPVAAAYARSGRIDVLA